ncbi:MAG TPA: D-alanyl-D-alanine endopeptidase [Candidatus Desulfobacillus sp.]|nr:D-alanyl-D-alanine endopeptidase [Candidatus Desulfobacillus sp.]
MKKSGLGENRTRKALFAVCVTLALGSLAATDAAAAAPDRKPAAKRKTLKQEPVRKAKAAKRPEARQPAARSDAAESDNLMLKSTAVVVQDQSTGEVLFEKNPDAVLPIASITKLMTAMVVLDAQLPLDEILAIGEEDVDTLKGTRSHLRVGSRLSRENLLLLALMASENRAAAALSRHYPGGREAFIGAMNHKAAAIGLKDTRFHDATGLTAANVSSARDLTKMVAAASRYPLIRELSTTGERILEVDGRGLAFHNTNLLVRSQTPGWEIAVSKTGYIREAGKCLVMQAWLNQRPVVIVLLDSWGRLTRIGDANRIKRWIESASAGASRPSAALGRGNAG